MVETSSESDSGSMSDVVDGPEVVVNATVHNVNIEHTETHVHDTSWRDAMSLLEAKWAAELELLRKQTSDSVNAFKDETSRVAMGQREETERVKHVVETHVKRTESMEKRHGELLKLVGQLQGSVSTFAGRISKLEEVVSRVDPQVQALAKLVINLETTGEENAVHIAETKSSVDALQSEIRDWRLTVEDVKLAQQEERSSVDDLTYHIAFIEEDLDSLRTELRSAVENIQNDVPTRPLQDELPGVADNVFNAIPEAGPSSSQPQELRKKPKKETQVSFDNAPPPPVVKREIPAPSTNPFPSPTRPSFSDPFRGLGSYPEAVNPAPAQPLNLKLPMPEKYKGTLDPTPSEWVVEICRYLRICRIPKDEWLNVMTTQVVMSLSRPPDSEPSRGTTDSPHQVTDERKRIRAAERGGKARSRRCRFRGMQAFQRRREQRRFRQQINRRLHRIRKRLRAVKRYPRHIFGSGAPSKSTKKRSTVQSMAEISCGTFNVRSLTATWRRFELVAWCAEYGLFIFGIQEHGLYFEDDQPTRTQHLGGGWRFIYSSTERPGYGGVGCFLSSSAYSRMLRTDALSSRLLQVSFRAWMTRKAHFLIGYSPTAVAEDSQRLAFFSQLSDVASQFPCRDFLCVLADLNATLVDGDPHVHFTPKQESNSNRDHLTDLMSAVDLISCGTLFLKASHSLVTFKGPRERRVALDHVLVRRGHRSWIMDANTKGNRGLFHGGYRR